MCTWVRRELVPTRSKGLVIVEACGGREEEEGVERAHGFMKGTKGTNSQRGHRTE